MLNSFVLSGIYSFAKTIRNYSFLFVFIYSGAFATNFTSSASGNWTSGSNWVSGTAPSLTNQDWGNVNINHDMTIAGSYNVPNSTVYVNAGKTLTINGNLTMGVGGGGNAIHVYGTLNVTGNIFLTTNMYIYPGGKVVVDGNLTVQNSQYLTVGTNVAPPAYADLVIKQNLISDTSGDVLVRQNGRVAVYGNLTNNTSGGSLLTINNGGKVYIHGNINLAFGGNTITSPATSPYGLYVDGSVNNPSSSTTSNRGDSNNMQANDPGFYSWVAAQSGSPLPITLLFFNLASVNSNSIALKWATSSELNFDYFLLERSIDGRYFEELAQISGSGNSSIRRDYEFEDDNPITGKSYYRLTSVDFDGYREPFNIVAANFNGEKTAAVYPNPVSDGKLNIKLSFVSESPVVIEVRDMNGMKVSDFTIASKGDIISLMLPAGTFIVRIKAGDFVNVVRVISKS